MRFGLLLPYESYSLYAVMSMVCLSKWFVQQISLFLLLLLLPLLSCLLSFVLFSVAAAFFLSRMNSKTNIFLHLRIDSKILLLIENRSEHFETECSESKHYNSCHKVFCTANVAQKMSEKCLVGWECVWAIATAIPQCIKSCNPLLGYRTIIVCPEQLVITTTYTIYTCCISIIRATCALLAHVNTRNPMKLKRFGQLTNFFRTIFSLSVCTICRFVAAILHYTRVFTFISRALLCKMFRQLLFEKVITMI